MSERMTDNCLIPFFSFINLWDTMSRKLSREKNNYLNFNLAGQIVP